MPSHRLADEKRRHLVELAKGWGRIAAENAYGPQGPGLDVDLAGLETIAVELQQALLSGFCEVSVLIDVESNYLLNPRHADFPKIGISSPRPFEFDSRLAK